MSNLCNVDCHAIATEYYSYFVGPSTMQKHYLMAYIMIKHNTCLKMLNISLFGNLNHFAHYLTKPTIITITDIYRKIKLDNIESTFPNIEIAIRIF